MKRLLTCLLLAGAVLAGSAGARAGTLDDVFVIDMENHNATQPSSVPSPQPIYGNPAAPYINSLITPGNPNSAQASYAPNYYNVAPGVHPSLPNYLWQEQGTNNGVFNDNMPFGPGGANQGNRSNLSGLLQANGISWKSYQEDTNINTTTGKVLPQSQWTVPLTNQAGTFASGTNPYNGSNQYNFATKHDGQLYFNATNGSGDPTTANPSLSHYAPLQQLSADLASNNVARYTLITPDQFNDMHTALTNGFTYNGVHYTGDPAAIAQGDNFLSMIVPQIMASQAYKNNGAIVIWFDETENGDSNQFTLPEIILSPLAKGNAYASPLSYTHSSDLKSLEELFGVYDPNTGGFLGDANTPGTNDLADLFTPGAIIPEPTSLSLFGLAAAALAGWRWRRRKAAA